MMNRDVLYEFCLKLRSKEPFPKGRIDFFQKQHKAHGKKFKTLLGTYPNENAIQNFIEANPVVLLNAMFDGFDAVASERSSLFSKVKLGSEYETDFAFCTYNSMGIEWTFIELERADVPLFNKSGDPSKYLSHAIRQVFDWNAWLKDHTEYASSILMKLAETTLREWGWENLSPKLPYRSFIIIGRRSSLTEKTNRRRAQLCVENPHLEIMTYDRLLR